MTDCIFCKIARGEIPGDFVYRDDEVMAFRDINPQAPVHILIIPTEHCLQSVADITKDNAALVNKLLTVAASIAKSEGLSAGWRIISNVGKDGGQTVPHLHFHLLGGKNLGENLLG